VNFFRKKGWKSVGVDASLPMLQIARGGVAGDMRRLPFRRKFARVTCLYDSLNHLLELEDLTAAFRSVRGVMDPDSLFLFDVNHPEIYPEVWGLSEPYISSARDYHLEIATTYRKREKIGRAAVTGWAKIDGKKVEIREQHRQRAYSEREITKALAEAGLVPVDVIHFDPYGERDDIDAVTVKLFFVARPAT
jgi:SAM-dependent methyltransferase